MSLDPLLPRYRSPPVRQITPWSRAGLLLAVLLVLALSVMIALLLWELLQRS